MRVSGPRPVRARVIVGVLGLSFAAGAQTTSSAAADFGGVDQLALRAPTGRSPLVSLDVGPSLDPGQVVLGMRTSFTSEPVGGSQPSPSATGTTTTPVEGAFVTEWTFGVGLGAGFDVGIGLPVYVYQWGAALTPVGIGPDLQNVGLGDPRLAAKLEIPVGQASLTPRVALYLPLGNHESFTGEARARTELALSFAYDFERVLVAVDAGVRLRETSEVGATRWGPQALVTVGGAYEITETLGASAELILAPTLFTQPAPLLAEPGYLFPAEVALGTDLDVGSWTFALLGGTGLPLSRPSTDSPGAGLRRGPTSPLVRIGFDATYGF